MNRLQSLEPIRFSSWYCPMGIFALSDFLLSSFTLVRSSLFLTRQSLCDSFWFSSSANLLARVTAHSEKGCRPAGQIFVVITSKKGFFILGLGIIATQRSPVHKRIFRFSPWDAIITSFFLPRTGSSLLLLPLLSYRFLTYKNTRFHIRPLGIITLWLHCTLWESLCPARTMIFHRPWSTRSRRLTSGRTFLVLSSFLQFVWNLDFYSIKIPIALKLFIYSLYLYIKCLSSDIISYRYIAIVCSSFIRKMWQLAISLSWKQQRDPSLIYASYLL